MRSISSAVVLLSLSMAPAPMQATTNAPSGTVRVSLSPEELSVTGVTPGGSVALFGIAVHTASGVITRRPVAEVLIDADVDAAVVYRPRGGVPFRSVWVAVDVATGSLAVAAPEGYDLDHQEIDRNVLKKDSDGLASALELEQLSGELLLVRPGEGAWLLHAWEGGGRDGDRIQDGRLRLVFEDAQPIGGGKNKSPKKLKAGDVLAALDPGHLELRTLTITK